MCSQAKILIVEDGFQSILAIDQDLVREDLQTKGRQLETKWIYGCFLDISSRKLDGD